MANIFIILQVLHTTTLILIIISILKIIFHLPGSVQIFEKKFSYLLKKIYKAKEKNF